MNTYNAHTWEVEAGGSDIECPSLLQNKVEDSLEYVRPCLKARTKENSLVTSKLLKLQFHSIMEDSNNVSNNEFVKN